MKKAVVIKDLIVVGRDGDIDADLWLNLLIFFLQQRPQLLIPDRR